MINSRIITQEFDYLAPKSVEEALALLNQYGKKAKVLAGGTDLIIQLKQEKLAVSTLIDISKIPSLCFIEEGEYLRIGAAMKLREVRAHCTKGKKWLALSEAVSVMGKVQVWNMGTIGGNLCNASPSADTAPPLLVYDAQVTLLGKEGERHLDLESFFKGPGISALAPGEIMTEIRLGPVSERSGSAFIKIARVGADISKVTCAVAVERQGETCTRCRIALGAVAPVPIRAREAERLLEGHGITEDLIERAGGQVAEEIHPIDDIRSSSEYRREIAPVLFKDVFWKAWRRAAGEEV